MFNVIAFLCLILMMLVPTCLNASDSTENQREKHVEEAQISSEDLSHSHPSEQESGALSVRGENILDPTNSDAFRALWEASDLETVKSKFPFFSSTCFPDMPYNFGVVINNEKYQLFRSQALGTQGVEDLFTRLYEKELPEPSQVIFMNKEGYGQSALMKKLSGYFDITRALGPFALEEARIFSTGGKFEHVRFLHPLEDRVFLSGQNPLEDVPSPHILRLESGKSVNLYATRSNFFGVLKALLDNRGASLFHCTGGFHRTGMISLAIRHMQGGLWVHPFRRPIRVTTKLFWKAELSNLAEIEYYLHNTWNFRMMNINAMRTLTVQPEFTELRDQYKEFLNLPSACARSYR